MGCFLFKYEFWQCFRQDLYVFCVKNCFRNAKFSEFGEYWVWGWKFFDETPKRHILAWFHSFWAIDRANPFRGFCSRRVHKKKGHYKKSRRQFIHKKQQSQPRICGEFSTQPNSTKIGIRVGVVDVINHTKFDNDWSREYKVTEGRILACSIGIWLVTY